MLLSVRDPEEWYRSASNTIFLTFDNMPPEIAPWMDAVRKLLGTDSVTASTTRRQ